MKKIKSIVLLLMLTASVLTGIDASATVYNWSRYDLTFETPENGFVTFNSATRFEIQWEDMVMVVQLYSKYDDKKANEKKLLNENLQRKALGFNMYDLHNGKIKVKGFKSTYSIDGTMPDGSRAIIADLVSKRQNLIVEITVNYLFGNRETVEDMIKSFAENKDKKPNHETKRQKVQTKEEAERQQRLEKKKQEEKQPRREEKLYDA